MHNTRAHDQAVPSTEQINVSSASMPIRGEGAHQHIPWPMRPRVLRVWEPMPETKTKRRPTAINLVQPPPVLSRRVKPKGLCAPALDALSLYAICERPLSFAPDARSGRPAIVWESLASASSDDRLRGAKQHSCRSASAQFGARTLASGSIRAAGLPLQSWVLLRFAQRTVSAALPGGAGESRRPPKAGPGVRRSS